MAIKTRNIVMVGGGLLLLYLLAQKGVQAISDQFGIRKARFKLAGFSFPVMKGRVTLSVANNTPVAVPFNSFFGTINYGRVVVSNINAYHGGSLAPNAVSDINVMAEVNLVNIGQDAFRLWQTGDLLQLLTLNGMAHIDQNIKLPISNVKLI
ncbi:MAG: LEA type 2 family protein [Bacteroidota bacterium]